MIERVKTSSKTILTGIAVGAAYFIARKVTKRYSEDPSIDDNNPYLNTSKPLVHVPNGVFYFIGNCSKI